MLTVRQPNVDRFIIIICTEHKLIFVIIILFFDPVLHVEATVHDVYGVYSRGSTLLPPKLKLQRLT